MIVDKQIDSEDVSLIQGELDDAIISKLEEETEWKRVEMKAKSAQGAWVEILDENAEAVAVEDMNLTDGDVSDSYDEG